MDHVAKVGLDHVTVVITSAFTAGFGRSDLSQIDTVHPRRSVGSAARRSARLAPSDVRCATTYDDRRARSRSSRAWRRSGWRRCSEISTSVVDPATRGRRLGEALELLRALLSGEEVPTRENSSPRTERRSFPYIGIAVDDSSGRRQFGHGLIEEYGENFVPACALTVQGPDAAAWSAFPARRRRFRGLLLVEEFGGTRRECCGLLHTSLNTKLITIVIEWGRVGG